MSWPDDVTLADGTVLVASSRSGISGYDFPNGAWVMFDHELLGEHDTEAEAIQIAEALHAPTDMARNDQVALSVRCL